MRDYRQQAQAYLTSILKRMQRIRMQKSGTYSVSFIKKYQHSRLLFCHSTAARAITQNSFGPIPFYYYSKVVTDITITLFLCERIIWSFISRIRYVKLIKILFYLHLFNYEQKYELKLLSNTYNFRFW